MSKERIAKCNRTFLYHQPPGRTLGIKLRKTSQKKLEEEKSSLNDLSDIRMNTRLNRSWEQSKSSK